MSNLLKHKSEFITDTENILDRLNKLLTSNTLSVKSIFREIHSLKGAAGFAGLHKMEHLAHELENILSSIRNGQLSLVSDIEKILFHAQNYFIQDIQLWKQESEELSNTKILEELELYIKVQKPISIEVVQDDFSTGNYFSEFEETLLKEAMFRGEDFYRIICHIDNDEEMKYPRLFLVVNNLEKISNVVKIDPPMADVSKNNSKAITLYLTTNKNKSYIFQGLNFDRIREVEVLRLQYSNFLEDNNRNSHNSKSTLYGNSIEVETNKIEEIFNYSQDLYNKLLQDNIVIPSKKHIVEKLLSGMKDSLNSLITISAENAFKHFHGYCSKLGNELDKKVKFLIVGGNITIEREVADILNELLIQLIKNSIDHGIEKSSDRVKLNKKEQGLITLSIKILNDSLAITLEDDGCGVNKNTILKQSMEDNLIDNSEEISLLSLLSRPGFSTAKEINYYSGRGVGLDIVVNKVINKLDGKITLNNKPGKSFSVNILIPPLASVKKYTIFKYRNNSFGISLINVVEKLIINQDLIELGDNKTLNYKYKDIVYPIYTPWGRLSSNRPELEEEYGFIIRYLGKKAFLPVSEFVLEKEIFSSSIIYLPTENESHKMIKTSEKIEDFTLLLPSIINS